MRKIADFEVSGKTILVRADLNSPLEDKKIVESPRIHAHAQTIKELSQRGAKVVVLAHQGRLGDKDYTHLDQHANLLERITALSVMYVNDLIGEKAISSIKDMRNGEILLLENVRSLQCETESSDGKIIHALSPLADYFVLDALSVAHREHSSTVGFMKTLPSFAGDVLWEEVNAIEKVLDAKNVTFFLGGSKVSDSFMIMKKWLGAGKVKRVLVGGALAVLLLYAKGENVGNSRYFLQSSRLMEYVPEAKEILELCNDHVLLPVDVGLYIDEKRIDCNVGEIRDGQIYDIGPKTAELYKKELLAAGTIVVNGPAGVYELDDFCSGTKAVLEATSESKCFSLLGGGHTITAIEKFGLDLSSFGYVSLSGKALLRFLEGKKLPAIDSLIENEKKFPM